MTVPALSRSLIGTQRGTQRVSLWLFAAVLACAATPAQAQKGFVWDGELIHPGCVHALAMERGDEVPVVTAVSLEGCAASQRSRAEVTFVDGDVATIEDEALLGGGSFGYRLLNRLENGIFGLVVRRVRPDGDEQVSLAAVALVTRPMVHRGQIIQVQLMEVLGELWIPEMDFESFRAAKNRVIFSVGSGKARVERDVDFTRLGKMRKK